MIIDSPMYGHGFDAFRAHYMDYQANYLSQYPNNEYAMLADNVISPFNEYLNVALSCGFFGCTDYWSLAVLFLNRLLL